MAIFTEILRVELPDQVAAASKGRSDAFTITFATDGDVPFPQVILHASGEHHLLKDDAITETGRDAAEVVMSVAVPAGLLRAGHVTVQIEGCKTADIASAGGGDWVKVFRDLTVTAPPRPAPKPASAGGGGDMKLYFGIHKHMHQPYYNATDRNYWDGEKDGIFGERVGNYTHFIEAAARQYIDGGLPHAGLSTSWSGSLIEQLDRCARDGLVGGSFSNWNESLRRIAQEKTAFGNPRVDFSAFGFFHPLMSLIPHRDIVTHIEWHRNIIRSAFGVDASSVMFPPETAFHVRMIPALLEAGVEAIIYDSIHRFRACQDYPYAGTGEGMLPPNLSECVNPPVEDWLQLHNIWAGSKISPSLLRPEYVAYEDPDGVTHRIVAIPAERYIGNEDARGGFGALQYPDVLGQVYDRIAETGSFDPKHPPFFLLHSDGDNHGGGADSYYMHNTSKLVEWLNEDPRFELTTVKDYLQRFPPDPATSVHIEPGSWAGADNGDPQFMKWFSRYDQPYSPDLNSWSVLTALQNVAHSLEDATPDLLALPEVMQLLLAAETSCYWYWTGQHIWDQQVTNAANLAWSKVRPAVESVVSKGQDKTGPTIFAPWVIPENPGGKRWGQGSLDDAPREATVRSFVYDVSGLKRVDLVIRSESGDSRQPMDNHGPYPTETGAQITGDYVTADLPVGAGDIRYFIEAEDQRGNIERTALERIYLA